MPLNQKYINMNVVKKFLSEKEFEEFTEKYLANREHLGQNLREWSLKRPITADEMEIIRFYTQDTKRPMKEYCAEKKVKPGYVYGRVQKIALRIVAQHPEVLDQVVVS